MHLTLRLVHRLSKRGISVDSLCHSHQLNQEERKYRVHERELLVIVLLLRVWRHLLYGSDFQDLCTTDHRLLQHFLTQANLSPRKMRWQQFMSEYNLSVEYVRGMW